MGDMDRSIASQIPVLQSQGFFTVVRFNFKKKTLRTLYLKNRTSCLSQNGSAVSQVPYDHLCLQGYESKTLLDRVQVISKIDCPDIARQAAHYNNNSKWYFKICFFVCPTHYIYCLPIYNLSRTYTLMPWLKESSIRECYVIWAKC